MLDVLITIGVVIGAFWLLAIAVQIAISVVSVIVKIVENVRIKKRIAKTLENGKDIRP